ncbi:MAG TPA: hypothetical protein VGN28_09865 [Blastococcus sp.]|jgi:hypothetical protein|nr:hypothetical protein [Blastococcus sp.]
MFSTALVIVVGLVIVGLCFLGLRSSLERGLNPPTSAHDEADPARAEALRQMSRDIAKGDGGGFS